MTGWLLLFLGWSVASCAVVKDEYLAKAVGHASQTDVRATLGTPTLMRPGEQRGGIRWIYRENGSLHLPPTRDRQKNSDCIEYQLGFDPLDILREWVKTPC